MNSLSLIALTKSTKMILIIVICVVFFIVSILILKEIFWNNKNVTKIKHVNRPYEQINHAVIKYNQETIIQPSDTALNSTLASMPKQKSQKNTKYSKQTKVSTNRVNLLDEKI